MTLRQRLYQRADFFEAIRAPVYAREMREAAVELDNMSVRVANMKAAARQALQVFEELDEGEMARLRGRADVAIKALRLLLQYEV